MAEYGTAGDKMPTGVTVSRPSKTPKSVEVYEGRITEDYLVQQRNYTATLETYVTRRARLQENDRVYQGKLNEIFPDETALSDHLFIQNQFKSALHDHGRLAAEGRGMPRFIELGDREADKIGARVRESICDTYWVVGRGKRITRPLFLDLGGAGNMALSVYWNDESPYPQYTRLDPRFAYPDYRSGKLYSLTYCEQMRERVAAAEHPDVTGLNREADNKATVDFIAYYDKDEVCEAFIKNSANKGERPTVYIVQRWVHGLGRTPVAYHQAATYDNGMRGLFDQLAGPMMVRSKAVRFAVDYMEQAAYSPLFAENILNATEKPGPTTVYIGDPDAEPGTVHLERIGPAVAGSTIWNLISYMGEQEDKESMTPAGRQGTLPQSQASGSFSNSTQGMLTSVIIEMQEGMSDLREQLDEICMRIDEKWLDVSKPLVRAVGKKKTYKPSKDIAEWYYHTVEFGAGAGLDKLNTDNRVLNHVAGRLIDRGTAREQIDYLSDSSSIQEKIDNENIDDALLQRYATDPTTPFSSLVQVSVLMKKEGMSFIEALEQVAPDVVAAEQAAAAAKTGATTGQTPPEGAAPTSPDQAVPTGPAAGGLPAPGQGQTPVPQLPSAPLQQLFGNQGIRR